jgi:D-alanyl-D-alanine carboxypeptidase (penicillin-binding protein 5/6)
VAVVSANDCAVALGEHLAGSEESFVAMMNARAKELGMENTRFVNACGLTAEGHLTSAYDIGLMSAKLMGEHPWIADYATIWQDSIRNGASVLNNTNKLLKSYQGITGLKTGYTSTAGYCISATAQREGLPLIAVIMGAGSSADRNADAAALLNWGFANFAAVTLGADRPLLPLPVEMGRQDTVMPELGAGEVQVLPREGLNRLEKTLELPESLQAPVEKGQQIGQLVVTLDGKEVCRVPVLAAEGVERLGLWDVFRNFFECFFKV